MEVHGPNPKSATTSCYYMIVEFEEPMSPKLIPYDAGLGMILPKMYDIVNHKATYDDDTGELVFNLQTEARYNTSSTTRRRILMMRNTLATGGYFWYCMPSIIFLSQSHNLSSSFMLQKRWCSHAPNLRS